MSLEGRRFCQLAAGLLALATIISALGAHALRPRLTPDHYEVLQTALHFQFFHSLGLLAAGMLQDRAPTALLRAAGWLLLAGIVLFSGSLYLLLAGAPRALGILTPVGGLALIAAWCLAALGLRARPAQEKR